MTPKQILIVLYIKYEGDRNQMMQHIRNKDPMTEEDYAVVETINEEDYITLLDAEYPFKEEVAFGAPLVIERKELEYVC